MAIIKQTASTIRLIATYLTANLQAAMEYRTAFIVQVVSMALIDCLWLFFWWSYFRQFPLTNGWQSTDIITIWSISAAGFGLGVGLFGNARQLASLIINGGLDAYLGMPRNVLLHVCIAATSPTAWGDLLFGVIVYLSLLHPNPSHIVLYLLLICMVAIIFTSFLIILGSLAFFLGNVEGLAQQMIGALISFSTYPINVFNGFVKTLLFTVVPAGLISFVPLQLLRQFSWPLAAAMTGGTMVLLLFAIGLFSLGLRRYESGNLLGMQG